MESTAETINAEFAARGASIQHDLNRTFIEASDQATDLAAQVKGAQTEVRVLVSQLANQTTVSSATLAAHSDAMLHVANSSMAQLQSLATESYVNLSAQARSGLAELRSYNSSVRDQLEVTVLAYDSLLSSHNTTVLLAQHSAAIDSVNRSLSSAVESVSSTINMRWLVSHASASSLCPSNSTAIHVPFALLGQTGAQICAADIRCLNVCAAVKYMYVTMGGTTTAYAPWDRLCSTPLLNPWPWSRPATFASSLAREWKHGDVAVVCCRNANGNTNMCL